MSHACPVRGSLASEEVEKIAALGERGLNAGQIAMRLGGRSASTVYWRLLRLGLACPKRRAARRSYLRNGVLVTPFSDEEDSFIRELRIAGVKTPKIAERCMKKFGHRRTAHSIEVRLVMLANAEEREARP